MLWQRYFDHIIDRELLYFLIYKARKTQKREKRPGVPDAAETVVRVQAARRVRERQKIKRCRTE